MSMDSSGRVPARDRTEPGGLSLDQRLALTAALSQLRREFQGVFDTATIQRVLYTSHDLFTADSAITRFLRAKRFAHQQLQALARVQGHPTDSAPVVVFVSAHDDGCSPMASAFFQHLAEDRAMAWSAGPEPGEEVNPAAVDAMQERGLDISGEFPKPWTDEIIQAADLVVTVGCRDTCPIFPATRYLDWGLEDPTSPSLSTFRPIRDKIEQHVRELLDGLAIPTRIRPTDPPPAAR